MPDPIYKTKDGQTVTKRQLLDSGYDEDRINKGATNGILKLIGDTDSPDQSYKTGDGQMVTTKQLLESGYTQERINNGVYGGILMPESSITTEVAPKKKVGSISFEHTPLVSEAPSPSESAIADIATIKESFDLAGKKKEEVVFGGATVQSPDLEAIGKSNKLREDLKAKGYADEDVQGIYNTFKDFPQDAKNVDYDQLLKERKENPLGFERHISAYKWQTPLFNAIRVKEGEQGNATIQNLLSKQTAGDYTSKRLNTQDLVRAARTYIDDPEQQDKVIKQITNDRAIGYGLADESQWQSVQDDARYIGKGGPLNNYQVLGLQFMEDTDPKKAELYNRYVKGKPQGLWGEEDLVAGYEQKTKHLEDIGMSLQAKALEEKMSDLISKKNKGQLSEADVAQYATLYDQYSTLQKDAEAQKERYPTTTAMEADKLMQEATGQRNSALKRFVLGVGENMGDVVNFFADATESPFRSDREKIVDDLEDLGSKEFTQTYQRYRTKANQLVQDDGKINFTAPAIFNTISDVGSEIVSNIGINVLTGGAGSASKLKRLSSLFGSVFSTTYNDYYTQAIKNDIENPQKYATIHTAIEAATELINPDLPAVKKLINSSSTLGKIIKNVTQEQWDEILKSSRGRFSNILTGLKEVGVAAGKNAFQETFEEVAGQLGGNVVDATLFNQDVDLTDGLKSTIVNTLVGTLPMGFLGLPGQLVQLNRQQKYALYEVAQNKEKYLPKLEADVREGVLSPEKAEQIKAIIENTSKSLGELSANNTINIDQADNEKTDILSEQFEEKKPELSPEETIVEAAKSGKIEGMYAEMVTKDPTVAKDVLLDLAMQKYGIQQDGTESPTGPRDISMKTSLDVDEAVTKVFPDKESVIAAVAPKSHVPPIEVGAEENTPKTLDRFEVDNVVIPEGIEKEVFWQEKLVEHALNELGVEYTKNGSQSSSTTYYGLKTNDGNSFKLRVADHKKKYSADGNIEYNESTTAQEILDRLRDEIPDEKILKKSTVNETSTTKGDNKATEQVSPKEESGAVAEPPENIPPTEKKSAAEEKPTGNKSLANRLVNAKNVPEAAKEGIREKGLTYEPKSQQEAQDLAKSIIDEDGIDKAVLQAQAQKFGGDVNTLVQTESLNRLAELSDKETDPLKKLEYDKKFAEVGVQLDEHLRKQGRGISAVNYFYKKSPLGVQMMENAKRKEDFEQWSKPKEQSWKEFFNEMMKEPEFDAIVKEQVKEELKKERAEARKSRTKKVDYFFDKAKDQFKGGAAYSTIIPPQIITTALEGMKKAYHAGEAVAKIIQDAIDFISDQLGDAPWDKEKFRKEWEEKLKEPSKRKPLTDEELKARILEKFRKKLTGLSDKEKEEVVKKSFQKIVESGGLDYDDFKKIISDITGRGEMTAEEAQKLKDLVKTINSVEDAAKKAREGRTDASIKSYRAKEFEAGKAARDLSELLANKPDIIRRLTSIMQLNTLGIPALVNNPIYNLWNQMSLRYPIGLINSLIDRAAAGIAKTVGKDYQRQYNTSLAVQKEFFNKLGFGIKEAFIQLARGLNRQDYIQKELQPNNIRPLSAWRDLLGSKKLTTRQAVDKALQGTVGVPAEIVARTLNLGDKPQRFAAEGAVGATFANQLGLKDIDYKLFIEFPREEAYRAYKAKGLSDAEAGKKADLVRDAMIKEGQRSTFQQDNLLNDVINGAMGRVFGKQGGVGEFTKALAISPFIKIPSNAFWSAYNLINPEVAMIQAMVHAGRAVKLKSKGDNSSALAMREARYWFAHAAVGIAYRAVVGSLVAAGIFNPASDDDETKKEREGERAYELQGTVNLTKLKALLNGQNPDDVKGGVLVSNRWFGQWGTLGNAMAKKYEDMTPEQQKAQSEFWNTALGGMEIEGLKELQNGVFSNSSALISALGDDSGTSAKRYGINALNMFENIVHPAMFSQAERAILPYQTQAKADTFMGELKNTFLQDSYLLRKLSGKMPPARISVWGDRLDNKDNWMLRWFGVSKANQDAFARPIYDDVKRTKDIGFFPPAVLPRLNDKKLNVEQLHKMEEYIGQARKSYVAPFINDQAEIDGFFVKYSELNDEDKKFVLSYLYGLGRKDGIEKFTSEYPEFKEEEKEVNYQQDIQRDLFKTLSKYKK